MIRSRSVSLLLALALALGFATPAVAQTSVVRATLAGPPGSRFGWDVAMIGDWNADGRADFAVGAPEDDTAGVNAGLVRIVSGADLATYLDLFGTVAGERLGETIALAGDTNGDGFVDLAVGAPSRSPAGAVHVFSGEWIVRTASGQTPQTSRVLLSLFGAQAGERFGAALLGNLNMDNDGRYDLLVGSPYYDAGGLSDAGIVRGFSGQSGALLISVQGAQTLARFGQSLAKIRPNNNYDTDGMQEYLAGGIGMSHVKVISSATGQVVATINYAPEWAFGYAIAVIGDTTGDGRDEFVISAPDYDTGGGFGTEGLLRVYESEPGDLCIHYGAQTMGLGYDLAATGDVNLDGTPDFVAESLSARLTLYSGAACEFMEFMPVVPPVSYPSSVAGGEDVDGNGLDDVIGGAPFNDLVLVYDTAGLVVPPYIDEAWVIGTAPAPVTYFVVKYPAWQFAGLQVQVEVEYDHGAGFVNGYGATISVPAGGPPQRELAGYIAHGGPFSMEHPHDYRVRMTPVNTPPGDWSQPFPGHPSADRDRSGEVDVIDLGMWAASLNLTVGDPGFDPASDFNRDGSVGVIDLGIWIGWKTFINGE